MVPACQNSGVKSGCNAGEEDHGEEEEEEEELDGSKEEAEEGGGGGADMTTVSCPHGCAVELRMRKA